MSTSTPSRGTPPGPVTTPVTLPVPAAEAGTVVSRQLTRAATASTARRRVRVRRHGREPDMRPPLGTADNEYRDDSVCVRRLQKYRAAFRALNGDNGPQPPFTRRSQLEPLTSPGEARNARRQPRTAPSERGSSRVTGPRVVLSFWSRHS